jgi:hypothetical protein
MLPSHDRHHGSLKFSSRAISSANFRVAVEVSLIVNRLRLAILPTQFHHLSHAVPSLQWRQRLKWESAATVPFTGDNRVELKTKLKIIITLSYENVPPLLENDIVLVVIPFMFGVNDTLFSDASRL